MGARKLQRFKIPLQSEVFAYMKEKKGWPDKFCAYYSEKFWNNYQASGWKLSNGNQMKDWKACFNNQWQNLKYPDDIEKYKSFGGRVEPAKVVHISTIAEPVRKIPENDIEVLDYILDRYAKNPTGVTIEKLSQWQGLNGAYDTIKKYKLWPDTIMKADLQQFKGEAMIKAYIVYRTLDFYGLKGWTFSDTISTRSKLIK